MRRFSSGKDTEAAVGDLQVPQVHPEVVGGDERLEIGVDGDRVDVVGVRIAENASGRRLDHQVHGLQHRHLFRKIQLSGKKKQLIKKKNIYLEAFDVLLL